MRNAPAARDNVNVFNNSFTIDDRCVQKLPQKVYVTYDEASLKKRRMRLDGRAKMSVVEIMTLMSKTEFTLAPRKRLLHEEASSQQNHLGPVVTVDPEGEDLEWHLSVAEKRQFLVGETRKDGGGALAGGEKLEKEPSC